MKALRILVTATAAAGSAAFGLPADTPAGGHARSSAGAAATHQTALAVSERNFILFAAEAGIAEVEAAWLALTRSTNPVVRDFATRMIEDHAQTRSRLRELARAKGVALLSEPSVLQQSMLRVLEAAQGAGFDREYMDKFGIDTHRSTLRLYNAQLDRARGAELRAYVNNVLPRLEQHLQLAQDTQARLHGDALARRDPSVGGTSAARASTAQVLEARRELAEAVQVVQRMKDDPGVSQLLRRARAVFLVPDYGRAALGVGVQGGSGVLVTRQGDGFSNPVFFDLAGVSIGAQGGAAGGEVAFLLMTDRAVNDFKSDTRFSLSVDAGLTIANYSRREHASAGKVQDVIVWSGTRGAYAGAAVGVSGVIYDAQANRAYYGRDNLNPSRIIDGGIQGPESNVLGLVLAV